MVPGPAAGVDPARHDKSVLLFQASIQKFLAYTVVGAATFIGYVQLAIEAHGAQPGYPGLVIKLVVFFLALVIGAAEVAAARQYFLIATLDGELGLTALERELTRSAAPLIANVTDYAHSFDYSARKPRPANALTVITILIGLVILFVLLYSAGQGL
jgi:hypothetical protein